MDPTQPQGQSSTQVIGNTVIAKEMLPEPLREEGVLQNLVGQPLETFFKSYVESQKLHGSSIPLPKEEDPESVANFYKKLGRPDSHDGYEYTPPSHSTIDWEKQGLADMKKAAHEAGLTNKQFQALAAQYSNRIVESVNNETQRIQAERAANEAELKREYGANYGFEKALAEKALVHFFGDDASKGLIESLLTSPNLFRSCAKLGEGLNEAGTFGSGVQPNDYGALTYEGAREKINAVNSDPNHPYWDKQNPGHEAAKKEMTRLFAVRRQGE